MINLFTITPSLSLAQLQVVEVTNPSKWPLLIQPVFLHHYSHPQTIMDCFAELQSHELADVDFSQSRNSFVFLNQKKNPLTEPSLPSTLLQPQSETYSFTVAFTPKVDEFASTLLLIRNNLTVVDYVILQGQGSLGAFTINGLQPGSEPLMFEFTTAMMEKCQG